MIIDTHSHLQFEAYKDDLAAVLKRTREAGITCINVGTDFISSKNAVEFAEKYEGLYAAIGLHPTDVDEPFDPQAYKELAKSNKVIAIGEIGLDFFRKPASAKGFGEARQKQIFLQQLDLAKELNLPLIIHCRMAHDQMLQILTDYSLPTINYKLRGVIHCFTGTLEQAKKYIGLGFLLGINGIIFKFNIDEVIKIIPLENLLLETDCPYLTPPMAPSKRNEPLFMSYTIQKIAELKNISTKEVEDVTTQNAKKLFKI